MVIKTVYHFIDSNHGVEISSKRERLTEKRERRMGGRDGKFSKFFCLGGGQMTYFGKGRVCLGARGRMKLYKITIK